MPIQHHAVSLKEVNYLFPLYLYFPESFGNKGTTRVANLDKNFIETLRDNLDLDFLCDSKGDLSSTLGPEDVFYYIYAVLCSPEYRRRYADFLKSDFAAIPITSNRILFSALVELGQHSFRVTPDGSRRRRIAWFPVQG